MPESVVWSIVINALGISFMAGIAWQNQRHHDAMFNEHKTAIEKLDREKVDLSLHVAEVHRIDEDLRQVRHAEKNLEQRVIVLAERERRG